MLDLTVEQSMGDWFWNSLTGGSGGWQSLLPDCNTLGSGEILQLKCSVQNMPLSKYSAHSLHLFIHSFIQQVQHLCLT